MKTVFKVFLLGSLGFLVVVLYQADYLRIPEIVWPGYGAASFLLLLGGFFASAKTWQAMLQASRTSAPLSICLAGTGLSVFGKYIPGKVWMIAGRAVYAAQKLNHPIPQLSIMSLNTQLVDLWAGLVLGTIGLFFVGGFTLWGWPTLGLWLTLSVALFSRRAQGFVTRAIALIVRKPIGVPVVGARTIVAVLPWAMLTWVAWAAAFQLFAAALVGRNLPWTVGLAFPLAGVLGIMAIVSPGGAGVREVVLVGYLALAGMPLVEATTIAVASRVWFLAGEAAMFGVGVAAHHQCRIGHVEPTGEHDAV